MAPVWCGYLERLSGEPFSSDGKIELQAHSGQVCFHVIPLFCVYNPADRCEIHARMFGDLVLTKMLMQIRLEKQIDQPNNVT